MGETVPESSPQTAPATPMADSVAGLKAASKTPFFQTAVGRAVVKIVTTGVLAIISSLWKDPTVQAYVVSIGGVSTILSLARDFADSSIPNLP